MNTTTVVVSHFFMAAGILLTGKIAYDRLAPIVKKAVKAIIPSGDSSAVRIATAVLDSNDRSHRLVVSELNHIKGQLQDISQRVNQPTRDDNGAVYIQGLNTLAQATATILDRQQKIEKLLEQVLTTKL